MDRTNGISLNAASGSGVKRPRRNRVTPFGDIEFSQKKGLLMGNRGDLHAPDGTLGRQWRSQRWLTCVLENNGWKVPLDTPGHYYPLFFHDEAVALAAGHRPCGECRPDALAAFIAAWKVGHRIALDEWIPLKEIDRTCHHSRFSERQNKRLVQVDELPEGTFVCAPEVDARPMLIFSGYLWPWRHGGYDRPTTRIDKAAECYALTPHALLRVLRGGYWPNLDPELQPAMTI